MACGVVCTHGFADRASTWDPLRAELAGRRIETWDLPGHGTRAAETDRCTADRAVAELVEIAGDRPVVLVGHSAGGYLSLRAAVTGGVDVAGLVLVSTGPGFRDPARMRAWNLRLDEWAARLGVDPAVARVAHMHDDLVIANLASLAVPAVVVAGGGDRAAYLTGSRALADRLPDARYVEVEGAGHDVHRSHAALVAGAVTEVGG